MRRLIAVVAEGTPAFVDRLRRCWDDGDAVLPVDPRLPPPATDELLAALAPHALVGADGVVTQLGGARPVDDGDALVVATSGTTGVPKGVVLTHDAVAASARATSDRLAVEPGTDHWLACLPLAHVGGLSVVTRAILTGTALTVLPRPDPAAVADAGRDGATLVSLVATALERVDVSGFRVVVLGGARPPTDLPPNAVATYGMTETGSGVVYDGVPLDGVSVREVEGELQLRGPMLLRAYRDGTDPFVDGGWFPTGDAGTVEPDGTVRVAGRLGDVVVTGAEKVWPDPVEQALRTHPGVADVAVAGRDDPTWGQRVVAFVVPIDPSRPPTLDALRATVKKFLPAYAAPRELVLLGELPRTALGKVRRSTLAAQPPGS